MKAMLKKTIAALDDAIETLNTNSSFWKRELTLRNFQNTARDSFFSAKTKGIICAIGFVLATIAYFLLLANIDLLCFQPIGFVLTTIFSTCGAMAGTAVAAGYYLNPESVPNPRENTGKEVYLGLRALARERSNAMHGYQRVHTAETQANIDFTRPSQVILG